MIRLAFVLLGLPCAHFLDYTDQLVSRVCEIPALARVSGIVRRPLATIAVQKGLPLIDNDDVLKGHILAGRTAHPRILSRLGRRP